MRSGLGPNPVLSQPTSRGDDNEAAADGARRCHVRGSKRCRDGAGHQEDGKEGQDGQEAKGRKEEESRHQEEDGRQEVSVSLRNAKRQGLLPAFFIFLWFAAASALAQPLPTVQLSA